MQKFFREIFVHNNKETAIMQSPKIYISVKILKHRDVLLERRLRLARDFYNWKVSIEVHLYS